MKIREASREDIHTWAAMRSRLWPENAEKNLHELEEYFSGTSVDIAQAYVVETETGKIVGFMELNIRNFAEGSRSPRLPYIEAWYVDEKHRGKGYGKSLIKEAEKWARNGGYCELASDTTIDNEASISIHKYLGFTETERVVCFLKKLSG